MRTYAGYPPGVSASDIGGVVMVECATCRAQADSDESVSSRGRAFCNDNCLLEYAVDNIGEYIDRLRD